MSAEPFAHALTDGTEGYRERAAMMGAEATARLWTRVEQAGDVWAQLHPVDRENRIVCAQAVIDAHAETVRAEARRLCCGDHPSADHAARAEHSRTMALAEQLATAVGNTNRETP